ncbi:aminotransferase class III-fold pyridoxal phosphate-dependent enzyme, partial [Mycobacteroides abscessus]|uniref:aminotransferase class III-fold pyridoxal phosphate-dependent enzyme n=1 Tax=Mycobacteroides abscessus TaxID=36809 RepID=UPI000B00B7ED
GKPGKHKVISRAIAYHGTPQGALAITGLPAFKAPFEPLTPGGFRAPNTNFYRAPEPYAHDSKAFGQYCADRIAEAIEFEGPDTVAAVFLEPVQNAGGCFPPPPGYFERVREICDEYDVLLVSDEVICAFGRIGSMFACEDFGYQPDIVTCAKGMTSGYSPIGAMIATDRLFEPFNDGKTTFPHGYTFGGHPVSAAVALANLDIFEREGLNDRVRENAPVFRATLEKLYDLPIVGDVRGEGYFYGIELVKDKAAKTTFSDEESETVIAMRILIVGAGGVGSAAAFIAARRDFFEALVIADYDIARAQAVVDRLGDSRFSAARIDASCADDVAALCREHRITHALNAVDPRFV